MPVKERSATDIRSPLPSTARPRPGQIKPLTSVRAFAALYVACYHMVHPVERWGAFTGFMSAGYASVSFFFVLSGFILTYTYGADFAAGRGSPKRFWVARFARIYPVYLLCAVFAAYVYRGEFHPAYHAVAFAADLLMLQSWSIRIAPFFNIPGWSLCVEAFFYLLFPFIVLRLRPRGRTHAIVLMLLVWLLALVPPALAMLVDPVGGWRDEPGSGHNLMFALRRYPIFALPEFAAGVVLGWFHLRFAIEKTTARLLLAIGVSGTLTILWFSPQTPLALLHNGLLIPFYAMVILGLCYPGWLARVLSFKPLLILGEASYALYLLHFPYNDWVQGQFHLPETLVGLVWRLVVLIPLSIVLHFAVERPARRTLLSWFTRGTPSVPPR